MRGRVVWFQVISELERYGITLRSVSLHCEVALGTVYNWKAGAEPKHYHGELLVALYIEKIGKEPPMVVSTDPYVYRFNGTASAAPCLQSSLPST